MDIAIYEEIYERLDKFLEQNGNLCYTPKLVHFPKAGQNYPYVVFEEVRNNAGKIYLGDIPDKVSNLGYRVRIYAKTKGKATKMDIARKVAEYVDYFLSGLGLRQISFNPDPLIAEGDLYGIILMYNANFYNNRREIIL